MTIDIPSDDVDVKLLAKLISEKISFELKRRTIIV